MTPVKYIKETKINIKYLEAIESGEFEKRLKHFIRKTAQDKQFGFGIEDYY